MEGARARADEGEVSWDGDDLIEQGVGVFPGADGAVSYVERWRRLVSEGPVRAERLADGIRVEAGTRALTVRGVGTHVVATRARQGDGGWRTEWAVEVPVRMP